MAFVENGKIILNASISAVRGLVLEDDYVSFNARFGGKPHNIYVPMYAILGIYAAENGDGIVLAELDGGELPPSSPTPPSNATDGSSNKVSSKKRPSHLKVVK